MSTRVLAPIEKREATRFTPSPADRAFARRREGVLAGLAAAGLIVPLAASQGGYYPTAWGWSGLVLCAGTAIALVVVSDIRLTKLELAFAGGLAGLVVWTLVSNAWTI